MIKRNFKNKLKLALISSGITLFFLGMIFTYASSEPLLENRKEKEKIIKDYKISEKYHEEVVSQASVYKTQYENGEIEGEEYFDYVDLIYSDDYVEGKIIEENLEDAERLEELNKDIINGRIKTSVCATPMIAGAVLGAIGLVYMDDEEKELE